MRFCSLTASASLLALASLVFADADSDVISLTAKNFEESVAAEPLMLVEFFAPWYVLTCHRSTVILPPSGVVTVRHWLPIMRRLPPP